MVKYWLHDDYIVQEPGFTYAMLVLYIPVSEVNGLISWEIYVWGEDSEWTV